MELSKQFAEVCKKWGLPKDDSTLQLYACTIEVAYYIHVGQYEKNTFGFLETANLIKLLKHGTGAIRVASANGGEVYLNDPVLKAGLYMFLNTELQQQSMLKYAFMGIAQEKKKIKEDSTYLGVVFLKDEFTEPYTDEELQRIIDFEQEVTNKEGKRRVNDTLGHFVQKFLVEVPEVFGDFYCYPEEDDNKPQPALSPTKQYNVIGELLEISGMLEHYKGKLWLEDKWAFMDNSQRRKEVEGWLKSCERWEKKHFKCEEGELIILPESKVHRKPDTKVPKTSLNRLQDRFFDTDKVLKDFSEMEF